MAALYKAMHGDASSTTIGIWLADTATPQVIQENPPGTPNRLLFIGPGAPPAPPQAAHGYVLANKQDHPDYIPSKNYQRNSTGALNRVTRSAPGVYQVHMPGLAGEGGVAHVSARGVQVSGCQIAALSAAGTEQLIDVRCFGLDGQSMDSQFTAYYTRPGRPGRSRSANTAITCPPTPHPETSRRQRERA